MNTLLSTCAPNIETISTTTTIRESASEKTNDGTSNQLINLGDNTELKELINAWTNIKTESETIVIARR